MLTRILTCKTADYLYAEPKGQTPRATIFLIHGWPDLSFGWRYQIPLLVDLGLRVVAPDLIGFGDTESPKVFQDDLGLYSMKRASDDFAELARQLDVERIIIGGHDWGGYVVYRFALWYPKLVTHGTYLLVVITRNMFAAFACSPFSLPLCCDRCPKIMAW